MGGFCHGSQPKAHIRITLYMQVPRPYPRPTDSEFSKRCVSQSKVEPRSVKHTCGDSSLGDRKPCLRNLGPGPSASLLLCV